MLIIFEGADDSGKSTVIDILEQLLREDCVNLQPTFVCSRKSFKNHDKELDEYSFNWDLTASAIWDWRFWLETSGDIVRKADVIWDRSWITQVVYQRALGPWSETPNHTATYEGHLRMTTALPHLIVYCTRSIDTAIYSDDMLSKDKRPAVLEEYSKFFKNDAIKGPNVLHTIHISNDVNTAIDNAHAIFYKIKQLKRLQ